HLLPEFNAIENVAMPVRIARLPASQAYSRADEWLRGVGLSERLTPRPGMLSGGEQQRVAVARALVMHPAGLLADEPTGDLDEQTAESLHALLRDMHASYHLTSIIATHNSRLAAACDRVLRLHEGRLVAGGEAASLPLSRPFNERNEGEISDRDCELCPTPPDHRDRAQRRYPARRTGSFRQRPRQGEAVHSGPARLQARRQTRYRHGDHSDQGGRRQDDDQHFADAGPRQAQGEGHAVSS